MNPKASHSNPLSKTSDAIVPRLCNISHPDPKKGTTNVPFNPLEGEEPERESKESPGADYDKTGVITHSNTTGDQISILVAKGNISINSINYQL